MDILRLNSRGPTVELLQSVLKKIGYYKDSIDGIFGYKTHNAVIAFQKDFSLSPDGIVGPNTWNALMPYINGYTNYIIKENDTIYKIAQYYSTTTDAIITANSELNIDNLQVGETIIVPFSYFVPTNISYTGEILNLNINSLKVIYPFLKISSIGNSSLGNSIPVISFGNGSKTVLYSAAIHANEWITTPLLMKFIENLCKSYVNNLDIFGQNARYLFENVTLRIIPMINPDGVNLVTGLYTQDSRPYLNAKSIASNFKDIPFPSGWKANIEGIDLNLQFPAGWAKAKEIKYAQGFTMPAPRDFVGYGPLTAPESVALYNYTLNNNFSLMLTYHTQGRVIYYKYQDQIPPNAEKIAQDFSKLSGYSLEDTPTASSYAGYKDWFIYYYNRPGFTIEAGIGTNPLPISQFPSIYRENLGILVSGLLY